MECKQSNCERFAKNGTVKSEWNVSVGSGVPQTVAERSPSKKAERMAEREEQSGFKAEVPTQSSSLATIPVGTKQRERSLSPASLNGCKRLKGSEGDKELVLCKSFQHVCYPRESCQTNDVNTDPEDRLKFTCDQLMWTLKYIQQNPPETPTELKEIIESICEGLKSIMLGVGVNMDDSLFRRFLRLSDSFFTMIGSLDDNYSLLTVKKLRSGAENLLDKFLDKFNNQGSNAEGHLICYAFMSSIIYRLKDEGLLDGLMKKIVIRLYSTTTILWKACVSDKKGIIQMVHPEHINLFFYYCQLLEVLITVAPRNMQRRISDQIHEALKALEDDVGSLFQVLPNLGIILYGTILAAKFNPKICNNTQKTEQT